MVKKRFVISSIFIGLALCGCSSEKSSSDAGADKVKERKIEKPLNRSSNQPLGVPGVSTQNQEKGEPKAPALPTRSELRVISEEAKTAENEVKNVIEEFDANLDNREARQTAEAKFKKILPDYKEKMLQIGKAKLKETN